LPHILLVDDDVLRDALHKTLVRAGYEVEDASGGTEAVKAFRRKSADYLHLADKFGARMILAKPFSGAEVLAAVTAVLSSDPA
jgi:DNA-binding response OmpR family regulator